VAEATVLDLFCGSGSLGLECISRGAKKVRFNDISADSLAVLKKNLNAIGEADCAKITNLDYLACLRAEKEKFDLIFLDPPYRFDYGEPALKEIAKALLNEGGIVVYERDRAYAGETFGLEKFDERKYGKTYLTFFRANKEQ
ncbi:MAG: RsmD family RNA methyltransferase, partial [Clostridia bacterium]|nr:RsmD family RNA methyltransferase [Clostridia bacterium]